MTQTLSGELAEGQRKLMAIAAAGAGSSMANPLVNQLSHGPSASLHEMVNSLCSPWRIVSDVVSHTSLWWFSVHSWLIVDIASGQQTEVKIDPTKELSRLVSEHKYEEAFAAALHRGDVAIVSWLCFQVSLVCFLGSALLHVQWWHITWISPKFLCLRVFMPCFFRFSLVIVCWLQVDLRRVLALVPMPLSQGVLLALLQQLACDISNDTSIKVAWMTDVAIAINPGDPTIAAHVRPFFDQVYKILDHHRSLPTISASEANNIRLLMHVINSVLMSCKWFFFFFTFSSSLTSLWVGCYSHFSKSLAREEFGTDIQFCEDLYKWMNKTLVWLVSSLQDYRGPHILHSMSLIKSLHFSIIKNFFQLMKLRVTN